MKPANRTPLILLLLALLLLAPAGAGAALDTAEAWQAFVLVNEARRQSGLPEMRRDGNLDQAAAGHADYLAQNRLFDHFQLPFLPMFTGFDPAERATNAGYSSFFVGENLSGGHASAQGSVDGLMSAIYHRFNFLSLTWDEMGIAFTDSSPLLQVYDLGNRGVRGLCEQLTRPVPDSRFYYTGLCVNGAGIPAEQFDAALAAVSGNSPELVLWPPEHGWDIPTIFYEESPDPLPDRNFSGYPVSVQFNPSVGGQVTDVDLRLFRAADGQEVQPTRLLNATSDPSGVFSDSEFALFPLAPLAWDTRYKASLRYRVAGTPHQRDWYFTTRSPGARMFTLSDNDENIRVGSGSRIVVHIPPSDLWPFLGSYQASFSGNIQAFIHYLDSNTLTVAVTGSAGARLTVTTSSGHRFHVEISSAAPLGPYCADSPPPAVYDPVRRWLQIPAVRVDGGQVYRVEMEEITGANPLAFSLLHARLIDDPGACGVAAYSSTNGELQLTDVAIANFPSLIETHYRATLRQQEPATYRFAVESVEQR